jgi:hypothetical protein
MEFGNSSWAKIEPFRPWGLNRVNYRNETSEVQGFKKRTRYGTSSNLSLSPFSHYHAPYALCDTCATMTGTKGRDPVGDSPLLPFSRHGAVDMAECIQEYCISLDPVEVNIHETITEA